MKKNIFLALLFLSLPAFAASFAYVDTEAVLQASKEFKECEQKALSKRDIYTDEITQRSKKLEKLQEQIAALSAEKSVALRNQYAEEFDRIERYRDQAAEEITAQHSHDMQRIATKIRTILENLGERDKVTLMFDLKAVLYLDPKVVRDYTKEVTDELNRQYDEEVNKLRSKLPLNK